MNKKLSADICGASYGRTYQASIFLNVKAFNAKMKYDVHVNMCNFIVLSEEKCVDNT